MKNWDIITVCTLINGKPGRDFAEGDVKLREESGSRGLWQATLGE